MTHSFPTRRASDLHSMAPLAIGAAPQGSYRLDGEIDDARIWNAARTPAQIAESASVPLTGNETGLVGYWRFDEATGRTAAASSPGGAEATSGAMAPQPRLSPFNALAHESLNFQLFLPNA